MIESHLKMLFSLVSVMQMIQKLVKESKVLIYKSSLGGFLFPPSVEVMKKSVHRAPDCDYR